MVAAQGETKVLKLKNLRPQDYASYSCQVSVRNVCGIPDKAVSFRLTNTTGTDPPPAPPLAHLCCVLNQDSRHITTSLCPPPSCLLPPPPHPPEAFSPCLCSLTSSSASVP